MVSVASARAAQVKGRTFCITVRGFGHSQEDSMSDHTQNTVSITAAVAATRPIFHWRVVDIAAGAALGAVSGVLFWAFTGLSYGLFPALTLLLPG